MDNQEDEVARLKARLAELEKPAASPSAHKTAAGQVLLFGGLGLFAFLILAFSCHNNATAPSVNASTSTDNTIAAADPAPLDPPPPSHNWTIEEGGEYGYPTALSDDDKKAGKGASDVLMFRYLGKKNGVYTVASSEGVGLTRASCTDPCQVVKISSSYGDVQHVTFNPQTIIGSALQDAFDGQLKVYGAKDEAPTATDSSANLATNSQ